MESCITCGATTNSWICLQDHKKLSAWLEKNLNCEIRDEDGVISTKVCTRCIQSIHRWLLFKSRFHRLNFDILRDEHATSNVQLDSLRQDATKKLTLATSRDNGDAANKQHPSSSSQGKYDHILAQFPQLKELRIYLRRIPDSGELQKIVEPKPKALIRPMIQSTPVEPVINTKASENVHEAEVTSSCGPPTVNMESISLETPQSMENSEVMMTATIKYEDSNEIKKSPCNNSKECSKSENNAIEIPMESSDVSERERLIVSDLGSEQSEVPNNSVERNPQDDDVKMEKDEDIKMEKEDDIKIGKEDDIKIGKEDETERMNSVAKLESIKSETTELTEQNSSEFLVHLEETIAAVVEEARNSVGENEIASTSVENLISYMTDIQVPLKPIQLESEASQNYLTKKLSFSQNFLEHEEEQILLNESDHSMDTHQIVENTTQQYVSTAVTENSQQYVCTAVAENSQQYASTAVTENSQYVSNAATENSQQYVSTAVTENSQQYVSNAATENSQQYVSTAVAENSQQYVSNAATENSQQYVSTAVAENSQQYVSTAVAENSQQFVSTAVAENSEQYVSMMNPPQNSLGVQQDVSMLTCPTEMVTQQPPYPSTMQTYYLATPNSQWTPTLPSQCVSVPVMNSSSYYVPNVFPQQESYNKPQVTLNASQNIPSDSHTMLSGTHYSNVNAVQFSNINTTQYASTEHVAQYVPSINTTQYVPNVNTAQYVSNVDTTQYVSNTTQYVPSVNTAQYVPNVNTAQYVPNVNTAQYVPNVNTTQYVANATQFVSNTQQVAYPPTISQCVPQHPMFSNYVYPFSQTNYTPQNNNPQYCGTSEMKLPDQSGTSVLPQVLNSQLVQNFTNDMDCNQAVLTPTGSNELGPNQVGVLTPTGTDGNFYVLNQGRVVGCLKKV